MSRFVRNTAIQFKIEVTYGVDPGSWVGADAVLIANASFDNPQEQVMRELLRGHMGGFEQMATTGRASIAFDVEFSGSGAAGTAPAWGRLLRAAGMAQTITAGNRVEYNPISAAFESATIRYSLDGVIYTVTGARGTVGIRLNAYGLPYLRFEFTGLNAVASAAATPTLDYSAFIRPLPINTVGGAEYRIGPTLTAGVVAAGTIVATQALELMLGQQIEHQKIIGSETIDIVARESTGQTTAFLAAADEVAWHDAVKVNTLTSFGFNLGSAAGARVSVFCPTMQRAQMTPTDYQGRAVVRAEMRMIPSAGNDELRIIAR
jgi:hypothetical protein